MSSNLTDTVHQFVALQAAAPCVGQVGRVSSDGRVWVDFPGNSAGLVRARLATAPGVGLQRNTPVLLVFDQQDPARPIVIGAVEERVTPAPTPTPAPAPPPAPGPCSATVDGRQVVLEGREEVVLRCGKASITLRKDGKIAIRGAELLSRATGTNRIRGGSVAIN